MDFLKGLLGAATGLATGNIPGAILGGVSGLTSSGPQESPVMKQARLQQQQIANQMLGYANSVPGSSPDELANMANSRAMLGEQQRQVQNRTMGAWNPNQGTSATGLLSNLGNTQIAQQMAQRASFLQDASANRRRALMDAANLGQGAASLYRPQQPQFPQVAGQLAQLLAYQQAQRQAQQQQGRSGDIPVGGTGADLTQAQFQGPAQPPPVDWGALTASGALGSPAPEDWGIYGTPAATQAVNAQTGQQAPGQVANGVNNQIRQANGFSTPMAGGGIPGSPNMMMLNMLARQFLLPGGLKLGF